MTDENRGNFRVGESHDAPVRTGSVAAPVSKPRLPPIEWSQPDRRKILADDLLGSGSSLLASTLGVAVLIGVAMCIAIVIAAVLNVLGFDPSSLY